MIDFNFFYPFYLNIFFTVTWLIMAHDMIYVLYMGIAQNLSVLSVDILLHPSVFS